MSNSTNREPRQWSEIFSSSDPVETEIVRDLLESSGIEVVVDSARISPYPVNIGDMSLTRLLVMDEDTEKANDMLKGMIDEENTQDIDS